MIRRSLPILALLTVAALALPQTTPMKNTPKGQYAQVNGLKMYYEVHGPQTGKPLVLLHGAFGTADGWGLHLPTLTRTRKVIVVEQQGHGHTPDREAPLSFETMADDTAALMKSLKIEGADVFGYSDGGTVALALAIRHAKTVGKIAVLGACAGKLSEVYDPKMYRQFLSLPDDFAPPVLKEPYDRVASDPSKWPVLVGKIKALGRDFRGFTEAEVRSISAPTLILQGDGDGDGVKPEHAVEIFRWIPKAQLEIYPGGDHFVLYTSPERVLASLTAFFDAADAPKGNGH